MDSAKKGESDNASADVKRVHSQSRPRNFSGLSNIFKRSQHKRPSNESTQSGPVVLGDLNSSANFDSVASQTNPECVTATKPRSNRSVTYSSGDDKPPSQLGDMEGDEDWGTSVSGSALPKLPRAVVHYMPNPSAGGSVKSTHEGDPAAGGFMRGTPVKPNPLSQTNEHNSAAATLAGSSAGRTVQWDPLTVDIEMTQTALQQLEVTIEQQKEKLASTQKERLAYVDDFLKKMESNSADERGNSKVRNTFEQGNKQSNKKELDIQSNIEMLELARRQIALTGVPKGSTIKSHIKSLKKEAQKKTKTRVEELLKLPNEKSDKSQLNISTRPKANSVEDLPGASQQPSKPKELASVSAMDRKHGKGSLEEYPTVSVSERMTHSPKHASLPPQCIPPGGTSSQHFIVSGDASTTSFPKASSRKTSKSSLGIIDSDNNVQLDHRSVGGSLSTDDDTNHKLTVPASSVGQLQSWQSKVLEQLQSLHSELADTRLIVERLEGQLHEQQRSCKTGSEISTLHIQNLERKVEKMEAEEEEFHQQTRSEFQNYKENFKSLEGKLEYWVTTTSRNLRDNIEGVENQTKQLEGRVENLSQGRGSSWWNQPDSSLHTHLMTSCLHLLAFVAILLSSGLQFVLKIVNWSSHMLQHRTGLSVLIILVCSLLALMYHWNVPALLQLEQRWQPARSYWIPWLNE